MAHTKQGPAAPFSAGPGVGAERAARLAFRHSRIYPSTISRPDRPVVDADIVESTVEVWMFRVLRPAEPEDAMVAIAA